VGEWREQAARSEGCRVLGGSGGAGWPRARGRGGARLCMCLMQSATVPSPPLAHTRRAASRRAAGCMAATTPSAGAPRWVACGGLIPGQPRRRLGLGVWDAAEASTVGLRLPPKRPPRRPSRPGSPVPAQRGERQARLQQGVRPRQVGRRRGHHGVPGHRRAQGAAGVQEGQALARSCGATAACGSLTQPVCALGCLQLHAARPPRC
jgi:hypothetical protein